MEIKSIYNNRYLSNTKEKWSHSNNRQADYLISLIIKDLNINRNKYFEYKVLDVGCGFGTFTNSFAKLGFYALGIDISDVGIKLANENFPNRNFFEMDGLNPSFKETFDIIFVKGFSGFNTHDPNVIFDFCEKYDRFLNDNGKIIIVYASNFSGIENKGEMANWNDKFIEKLVVGSNKIKFSRPVYYTDYKKRFFPIKLIVWIKRIATLSNNFYLIGKKLR